jgi:D-tyrosyl-tRNA(Tyr) deacylase
MRALVQRVRRAAVYAAGGGAGATASDRGTVELIGRIEHGLAVLVGVHVSDAPGDADALAGRVARLRIFDDAAGRLNLSVLDVGGGVLSVPQFTLYGDARRGLRPSFIEAAPAERAEPLYRRFNDSLAASGVRVVPGRFRTHMIVEIHNDGPVTLLLETPPRSPDESGTPSAPAAAAPIGGTGEAR